MNEIKTIISLKEVHDLLETIEHKHKINVIFDIDLTLSKPHDDNEDIDVLIEPKITKDLFSYILKHRIYFFIVTARFYNTVCNAKKRNLNDIRDNLSATIFPLLEELGLDISQYKDVNIDDKLHIIKNDKGRCIGILYKGIFFSEKKGELIKYYRKEFGLDKSHPITIFIDDHETYLKGVKKHVPDAIILRREIDQ